MGWCCLFFIEANDQVAENDFNDLGDLGDFFGSGVSKLFDRQSNYLSDCQQNSTPNAPLPHFNAFGQTSSSAATNMVNNWWPNINMTSNLGYPNPVAYPNPVGYQNPVGYPNPVGGYNLPYPFYQCSPNAHNFWPQFQPEQFQPKKFKPDPFQSTHFKHQFEPKQFKSDPNEIINISDDEPQETLNKVLLELAAEKKLNENLRIHIEALQSRIIDEDEFRPTAQSTLNNEKLSKWSFFSCYVFHFMFFRPSVIGDKSNKIVITNHSKDIFILLILEELYFYKQ